MDISKLKEHIDRIRNLNTKSYPEVRVKQYFIAPILECLGWDIYDPEEVVLEYNTGGHESVDYALVWNAKPVVFIEAKGGGEKLQTHTEQLLKYAWRKAVPISILTNGSNWLFYLSWEKRDWPERLFCSTNLRTENIDSLCNSLIQYLSKEKVISGEATRIAQENLGRADIQKAMLHAWNALVGEPDPLLLDLVAQATKKKCPNKPDIEIETVRDFIAKNKQRLLLTEVIPPHVNVTTEVTPQSADKKAWYYWEDRNGMGQILAFVNAVGACSMRRFDAESGRFLGKPSNPKGNYQENFAEFIRPERQLHLSKQPNLVDICKRKVLYDWVLSEVNPQIRSILESEKD